MYSVKGNSSWVGKTFAFSKSGESGEGGKKPRIRRSKEERRTMVESFIKNYQKLNNGNFPSLNLTHKEVGGSFYTVREIVREIIQENRVLGPVMLTSEGTCSDQFMSQYPLGSISLEPQIPLSLSSDEANVSKHHEDTSEGVVIISEVDHELQNTENEHISDNVQIDVETVESDRITSTKPKLTNTSEAEGHEKQNIDKGHMTNGFQKVVEDTKSDGTASLKLQARKIAENEFHEQKAVDVGNTINKIQADIGRGGSNGLAGKELGVSETSEASFQEQQSVANMKSISEIKVGVNNLVSTELVNTGLQGSTAEANNFKESQTMDNTNIFDGVQVDIKSAGSDELADTEMQESGISEADVQEHQSATNGHISKGTQLGVKAQGSDEITSKEFQGNEYSKQYIDAKEMGKPSAKVNQLFEDVVVETFPLRPAPIPADSKDRNTANGKTSPKTLEEKEAPKMELGANKNVSYQNVSGKQKQTTAAAEATSPPVNSHAKALNGTLTNTNGRIIITEEASPVKAKAESGQNGGYQKENNATLDRMDLQSWERAAKNTGKPATNPILGIFRAFVHAFVKFWSE